MTKNEDFRYLCVDLPGDIARRKAAGDLSGALRLVEARLAGDCEPELAARLLKGPTIVFATMGVIPIVPGYGLYQTMEYMVQSDYSSALAIGMETLLVAGAIAMSLGFTTVFARAMLRRHAKAQTKG